VGRIESGVRVSVSFQQKNTRRVLSYDVLRQQKTGVMIKRRGGVDLPSSPVYNVANPSQTLRRHLVQRTDDGRCGECSTLAAVRRGFVFHTSRIVRLTTLYRPVCSKARYSSRIAFFAYPTCIRYPRWGGEVPSEYCHPGWYGKTRMVWLPDGEKIRRYVYSF